MRQILICIGMNSFNVRNKNASGSNEYDGRITLDDFEVINAKGTVYIKQ